VRTAGRLAAFAAAVGVVAGAAALAGAALGPLRGGEADRGDGHGHPAAPSAANGSPSGATGLAVAERGYRLVPERTSLPRDRDTAFTFHIEGLDGRAVTAMEVEHERPMHLIVVRRDLTGYQHLHPRPRDDGRWTASLRLPDAGVYRAYADFRLDGRGETRATDLAVPGPFAPVPLPPASPWASAGGYRVALDTGPIAPERTSELIYSVTRHGAPVSDIEPYLGADGHLVALRQGDLAFLHAHPVGRAEGPGEIRFATAFPSPGRYRLFLQFRHDGRVRTVAHTVEVAR
jgi:hypothetical protein